MSDRYDSPTLDRLCDALEGYPMRYGLSKKQKHIYCDTCSEPIFPGQDATHYLCDRMILGPDDLDVDATMPKAEDAGWQIGDFYLMRVVHRECESVRIPYPCKGYTELFLDATWDDDFSLERPSVLDVATKNEGLPWNPEDVFNGATSCLAGVEDPDTGERRGEPPSLREWLRHDPMALAPHDIIMHLIAMGIDPRHAIGDEGENIAPRNCEKIREDFGREGSLMEMWREKGDAPPGFRFPRAPDIEKHGGDFDFHEDESFSPDSDEEE